MNNVNQEDLFLKLVFNFKQFIIVINSRMILLVILKFDDSVTEWQLYKVIPVAKKREFKKNKKYF